MSEDFIKYPKTPRLFRDIVVTEKIDGTNAQIVIDENETIRAGSRNRWITPDDDNYGFARWVHENSELLVKVLGPGRHFGEWWGQGIQRNYNLDEKRFSLFNVGKWGDHSTPETRIAGLIYTVPTLLQYTFSEEALETVKLDLEVNGSKASPGFMEPEGYIVYHTAGNHTYKVLLENDSQPKGE
jgi:hypothetical protein